MNRHLDDKELSGYIHQTLTDAQRESMNMHLDACPRCRERVAEAKTVQRRIHYSLSADLRRVRPRQMQFDLVKPRLARQRSWATFRFYSMQVLSTVAVISVVVAITTLIIAFVQSRESIAASPIPATSNVLQREWDDASPYRQGLLSSERSAVQLLDSAPIYHIALTIDDDLAVIHGEQEVRYTNRTAGSLNEVYFQLTPNLTNNQLILDEVTVNGTPVVFTPTDEFRPSLVRVPLPEALLPNRQVVIYMAFTLEMGEARSALNGTLGLIDDVLTLSNFYPTVAAYVDDKWQLEQPVHNVGPVPENSFYLVRVTTATTLPVIASGLEIGRDMVNGRQVVTFAAGPIGQFYLTASERYTVALSQKVGDTTVTSYAYAEHLTGQARDALGYAAAALTVLNERYGPYPFTQLQIIGTPTLGDTRPGTTYPGIILTDLNQYESVARFGKRSLESAVIFGTTQQWFGRILGSNRLKAPWLSESLSESVGQSVMTQLYGKKVAEQQSMNYTSVLDRYYTIPIGMTAYDYTLDDYLATMYGRGPDFLYIISHTIDQTVWEEILRDYYQTYKWNGRYAPTTASFQQLAEEHCECHLDSLFASWVERKNK